MRAVLISIQPYWVFLIIARIMGWKVDKEKTIEARKSFPKDEDWNRNVEIYCSKNKKSFIKIPKEYQPLMEKFLGKVIGEFVCERIDEYGAEFTDLQYLDACDKNVCLNSIKRVEFDEEEDGPVYRYETSNEEENPDDCKFLKECCLTFNELRKYIGETFYDKHFYGWHISDLKIYDKPKVLNEFYKPLKYDNVFGAKVVHCGHYKGIEEVDFCEYNEDDCSLSGCKELKDAYQIKRPPQSWCYVEEFEEIEQ